MEDFEPRGVGALQAYLRQAVLNRLRDELRRKGRAPSTIDLDHVRLEAKESPLEEAIGRQALERYEAALTRLRPEEREAIIARIEMGYSYEEMAEALDKPSAEAARKAAKRALMRLAEEMKRGGHEPAPPEDLFDDVAGAILDGAAVEWADLESHPAALDLALLEQLRVLAAVRTAAQPSGESQEVLPRFWGHLRVLERIGRGAFGEVYRAWDTRLDREVALKLLPLDTAGSDPPSSLIEEGRLLARVRHPNVVTIYGAERIGDRIGLWMEFVRGRTLERMLGDGAVFTPDDVVRLGLELCRAVSAVHSAALLHRDIKAQNVMVADDGRLVLMDFGTGYELGSASEGRVAGTPLYLAPEVLSGLTPTAGSDVLIGRFEGLEHRLPLWIWPASGRQPVRVGDILVDEALWLPDGTGILYVRGRDVWRVGRDGRGAQVLLRTSGDPQLLRLSPDGSRISYTLSDPETEALSLWEMNADGSDPKLRVGAASRADNVCCGSWTADGRYFIYSLSRDGVYNLWARADVHGPLPWDESPSVQLTTNATSTFASLTIDNGGRMFAFVAGTRFESVQYSPARGDYVPFLPDTEVLWPQFSPDSRHVAFQRVTDWTIWRSDADGSNPGQLVSAPLRAGRPRWSPDGTRIAFEAVSPGNPMRAYVVRAGGGPAEEIAPTQQGTHSLPAWSPDGRSIALAVNVRRADVPAAERGIFIVEWATRGATRLAGSEGLTAPLWSPDGRHLIAQTLDQSQVLRFDAAANGWVEIARGRSLSGPTWSPDSRFLYVQDIRESGSPVYRLRVPAFTRDGAFSLEPLLSRGFQIAAFQGLAPDGSLIVQLSRMGTQVHAIDLTLR